MSKISPGESMISESRSSIVLDRVNE
jgi:hypothetical protein